MLLPPNATKQEKALVDAIDYKVDPSCINPNYGLNKEIKVQLRRGKQGKLEYFSNN